MSTIINEAGTVVGVFDSTEAARAAVRRLKQVGFMESQIGLSSSDASSVAHADESAIARTALVGTAAGAALGTFWGLAVIAGIAPGIGPTIAGGTLGVLLANAATAAATCGIACALITLGVPKDDTSFYEEALAGGKTIVTVIAGQRADAALSMMKRSPTFDQ